MKNPRSRLWVICPQARWPEFGWLRLSEACLRVRLKKTETVGGERWRRTVSRMRFSLESIRWVVVRMMLLTLHFAVAAM